MSVAPPFRLQVSLFTIALAKVWRGLREWVRNGERSAKGVTEALQRLSKNGNNNAETPDVH